MKLKPTRQQILDERCHLFEGHNNCVTSEMEKMELSHAEMLHSLAINSHCSYSLLNLHKGKFTYHFSTYSKCLFHSTIKVSNDDNWRQLLRMYPEDDLQAICETEIMFYKAISTFSYQLNQELHLISLRRMLNNNGTYDMYAVSAFVKEFDSLRKPWLVVVEIHRLFGWETAHFYQHHKLLLLSNDGSLLEKRLCVLTHGLLTKQQREILHYALIGSSIKDSALKLAISESTVKCHRSCCNEKLNTTSIAQALLIAKILRVM